MRIHLPGLLLAGLAGCSLDGAPRDASIEHADAALDLALAEDLTAPPPADLSLAPTDLSSARTDLALSDSPCPLPCDGGFCGRSCATDAGRLADYTVTSFGIERVAIGRDVALLLSACVFNWGEGINATVPVSFRWSGGGFTEVIGTARVNEVHPGSAVRVNFIWFNPVSLEGFCDAWATVNDTGASAQRVTRAVPECDVASNESERVDTGTCGPP